AFANEPHMNRSFLSSFLLLCTLPAAWAEEPKEIRLTEGLGIRSVARAGRSAVHTDPIEAQIVAGTWKAPKLGDSVTLPDGSTRTWEAVKADDKGAFTGPAFAGGYAFFTVPSDAERVMMLEATGHSMVYVNGEPRTGDPYGAGYVKLPVLLKQG